MDTHRIIRRPARLPRPAGLPLAATLLPTLALLATVVPAQDTELLSRDQVVQANGINQLPHCSADGRFVVWQTMASNLVPGDTNNTWDIVLLDRQSGNIELVSRTSQGESGSGYSRFPTISADGRYVAFASQAQDVGPSSFNGPRIYDRITGTFQHAGPPGVHVGAEDPRISPDGRYLVYVTNQALAAPDSGNQDDVYRFDRITGATELVSVTPGGVQSNRACRQASVSAGGRYVTFDSWVQSGSWGAGFAGHGHIWRKDMQTGALEPVSVTPAGVPGTSISYLAMVSANGEWVAFQTAAQNLVPIGGALQIAAKNMVTGEVKHVTADGVGGPANNYSYQPRISPDGRYVSFRSAASNLPGGGTNAYYGDWVRDLVLGVTVKVSLSSAATGNQSATSNCYPGGLSATGRYFVFSSTATNLVAGDANGLEDIFLRDWTGAGPHAYGFSPEQSPGCLPRITSMGSPSASAGAGFDIRLEDVRGVQPGILIYSKTGPASVPQFGSYLYLAPPIVRTPAQNSGGTPSGCDGLFSFDFNSWISGGLDGGLGPGVSVWAQYWSRDPGSAAGSHLSDGIEFEIAP